LRLAAVLAVVAPLVQPSFAAPCQTGCPGMTALECAASGLQAHQWCEFANGGTYPGCANSSVLCHDDMASCGSAEAHPTESEQMFWDAKRKQLKFMGGPHNGSTSITVYDAATNYWKGFIRTDTAPGNNCPNGSPTGCTTSPMVGGEQGCSQVAHSYDHNTGDSARGIWYKQAYNSAAVYLWDGDGLSFNSSVWTTLPADNCQGLFPSQITAPIVYFPDRVAGEGLFRLCDGDTARVSFWNRTSNTWTNLHTSNDASCTLGTNNGYHQWAEYQPYAKLIWFGGEGHTPNSESCTFKADGTFDQEALAPATFYKLSDNGALISGDPASNDFIVRDECWKASDHLPGSVAWRTYNPVTETWADITWSMPPLYDDTLALANNCGATDNEDVAIPEYNVILYLTHGGDDVGAPKAFLYRHTNSGPVTTPSPPTNVRPQ
jgi:hypothetical protein